MDLLNQILSPHPLPRWTEAVRTEILDAGLDRPGCASVLAATFLGDPYQIDIAEMSEVVRIQIALNDGVPHRTAHLGEAESIYVADKFDGAFITDDSSAYDFAGRRIGECRVLDTVDLLRESVAIGHLTPSEAQQVADAIRNAGRNLRRGHPSTFPRGYFEPTQP